MFVFKLYIYIEIMRAVRLVLLNRHQLTKLCSVQTRSFNHHEHWYKRKLKKCSCSFCSFKSILLFFLSLKVDQQKQLRVREKAIKALENKSLLQKLNIVYDYIAEGFYDYLREAKEGLSATPKYFCSLFSLISYIYII